MNENEDALSLQETFWAELKEKRTLRRATWCIAIPAVVLFLISEYWAKILVALGERFGFTGEKIVYIFADPAAHQLLQIALELILFTIPFIICAKIGGLKIGTETGLYKPKKGTVLPYLFFGVGFCAFANIAVYEAGRIFKNFGVDYSLPDDGNPQGLFGFILVLLSTAIVPPILEEFAFRGIVMGFLKPFGEGFSIFASAAVFGLIHGNFDQIPFAFLVGMVLGYIRVKTGSIAITVLVHSINNLVAVVLSYAGEFVSANVENVLYSVYLALALLAAIFGVVMLKRDNFRLNKPETTLTTKKICVEFFFSPAVLIVCALFLYRASSYVF